MGGKFRIGERVVPKKDLIYGKMYGALTCGKVHLDPGVSPLIVRAYYVGDKYPECFRDQRGIWWHDSMVEPAYVLTEEDISRTKDTSSHFLDMMN